MEGVVRRSRISWRRMWTWTMEAGLRMFQEVFFQAVDPPGESGQRGLEFFLMMKSSKAQLRWFSLSTWSLSLKSPIRRWTSNFCDQTSLDRTHEV